MDGGSAIAPKLKQRSIDGNVGVSGILSALNDRHLHAQLHGVDRLDGSIDGLLNVLANADRMLRRSNCKHGKFPIIGLSETWKVIPGRCGLRAAESHRLARLFCKTAGDIGRGAFINGGEHLEIRVALKTDHERYVCGPRRGNDFPHSMLLHKTHEHENVLLFCVLSRHLRHLSLLMVHDYAHR